MGDGGNPTPMNGWSFVKLVEALRRVSVSISSQDILDAQVCLDRFPDLLEKQILKSIFIRRPQDSAIFETIWKILLEAPKTNVQDYAEEAVNGVLEENQESFGMGGQGVGRGSGGISLTAKGRSLDSS